MAAISGVEALASALPSSALSTERPSPVSGASTDGGATFANSITSAVDELRGLQSQADGLKVAAVTGDLDDIHAAMIASTRAAVTLELVAAVRNKGVDAFNEIMRMQA
ncbi:flagellar hook-basal body complex protein FliE [Microbacterium sp. USHLN186]|uniref:flagellar hook-basal body complex protein FliE n=1 Tax=Microbacterium sp. USHLN186 TaxID=3081286 RepID=UPI003017ACD2